MPNISGGYRLAKMGRAHEMAFMHNIYIGDCLLRKNDNAGR